MSDLLKLISLNTEIGNILKGKEVVQRNEDLILKRVPKFQILLKKNKKIDSFTKNLRKCFCFLKKKLFNFCKNFKV